MQCSAGLIELCETIKKEISEEDSAAHKYADMAEKFNQNGDSPHARTLRMLANQEELHREILNFIVEDITKQCNDRRNQ